MNKTCPKLGKPCLAEKCVAFVKTKEKIFYYDKKEREKKQTKLLFFTHTYETGRIAVHICLKRTYERPACKVLDVWLDEPTIVDEEEVDRWDYWFSLYPWLHPLESTTKETEK